MTPYTTTSIVNTVHVIRLLNPKLRYAAAEFGHHYGSSIIQHI